jgi:hypothetical protein
MYKKSQNQFHPTAGRRNVYVVPADRPGSGVIGRYRFCDHLYYVGVVPADRAETGGISWYHFCGQLFYVGVVPADRRESA